MENSKKLLSNAGLTPKLRLGIQKPGGGVAPTGPHRVKLISDKIVNDLNPETNKEEPYVVYTVEENGEKKEYQTKVKDKKGQLSYLVQRLAEVPENGEVILEMKKRGIKNYISVIPVDRGDETESDEDFPEEPSVDISEE